MGNGRRRDMIGNYWASLDEEVSHFTPLATHLFIFADHPLGRRSQEPSARRTRRNRHVGHKCCIRHGLDKPSQHFALRLYWAEPFTATSFGREGSRALGNVHTKLRQIDQNLPRPERGTTRVPGFAGCGTHTKRA